MVNKPSYGQILKSSSIMGGAAGINLLFGMIRTKFAAVLIGTTGVGLLAGFTAIQGIIGILAGLGIQSSAVREVAAAVGKNDEAAIGRAVLALRRISWLTGLIGMLVMIALAPTLSQMTFNSPDYVIDIATLGVVIFMTNLSGGRMAHIQGMRRIGDLARVNIFSAAFSTISAIGFYYWLGLRGIVPSLVVISTMQLSISWYYSRQITVPQVVMSWRQTFQEAGSMIRLGLVFMWTALLSSGVTYVAVTLISQNISLQAVGIYSAAFALSGMFVNFVLQAMSADFYPRLTGAADDKARMNGLVNEQTEIGLLLAVPGLMATMTVAPWIIQIFYTAKFLAAAELIQWFIMGSLIRVIQWPMGFLQVALGKSFVYFLTQTSFSVIHVVLIMIGIKLFGIEGVAVAFFTLHIISIITMRIVAKRLTAFSWSNTSFKLIMAFIPLIVFIFIVVHLHDGWVTSAVGLTITALTSIYCLREVAVRLGNDHRVTRLLCRLPGFRKICRVG